MIAGIKLNHLPLLGRYLRICDVVTNGLGVNFTSAVLVVVVVGVAMDTVTQDRAQLIMRITMIYAEERRIRGRRCSEFSVPGSRFTVLNLMGFTEN